MDAEGVRRDVGSGAQPKSAPGKARGPGIGTRSQEVTTATPAPMNALDNATRSAVREQAADQSRRIDEVTK
jgi:hypothetical protein